IRSKQSELQRSFTNLVRGLPTKHFENDQTYIACLKGKQHKASCKSKIQNLITQPLFMLHLDLFSPTFVSSLMNKKYCLVVTDDYSRFTWVFFLATKDETNGILKSFITEVENLVDKKVNIIRCDNGTEFKNGVISKFDGKSDEGFFVGYSINSKAFMHMGSHTLQQLRGYSFDEIKTLFETTMRKVNTFVPIESEVDRAVPKLAAKSLKRDAKEEFDQESSKRQKIGESSELAEEPRDKEADELSQEELQQMMIIVLEQGMNVKALQTKYPIIDWEIYTEGTRKYWKIIRVGNHTKVKLKRLFEPDIDDELWKLQKHIHDLTWRLYDSCGVHHVSTEKGIDIYMLVEKEYPLSRGTLTLMLVAKLLVDQDNKMSRELLRKIIMQVERPRR
ncbi:putative reverse transcriptase domain-containing protein, partial [Tanacetum coccineum]